MNLLNQWFIVITPTQGIVLRMDWDDLWCYMTNKSSSNVDTDSL